MKDRLRVAFVSRRNSLRSMLAEACLTHIASEKFVAFSCGQPGQVAASIHPAAVGALGSASIAAPAAPPKSWDGLLRNTRSPFHFVITLDDALADIAPRWPGQPELATWPFPDLALQPEGEELAIAAIRMLYSLRRRLELLASLPLASADRGALRSDLRDLAHWH